MCFAQEPSTEDLYLMLGYNVSVTITGFPPAGL